jgi:threonine/serine exporter ThrE
MAQTALQAGVEQKRALLDFVLQLGRAMNQPGAAVSETQERLERIAAAYGARGARIVVLPTTLIVSLGRAETGTIEKVPQVGTLLRLDQISDLFELVGRAERARVSVSDGRSRLAEILALPPRFGIPATIAGYVIFVVGICLILEPAGRELGAAAVLGAVVAAPGLMKSDRNFPDRRPPGRAGPEHRLPDGSRPIGYRSHLAVNRWKSARRYPTFAGRSCGYVHARNIVLRTERWRFA